jgi:hypothetical protein
MTIEQAKQSIGLPFIIIGFGLYRFDAIRTVSDDGTIEGDFYIASCEDCRFKETQPEHLKRENIHTTQSFNNPQLPLL